MILPAESVEFAAGNSTLRGVFNQGSKDPRFCTVLFHPHPLYGGGLDDRVIVELESALVHEGFGTFRFGFRGSPTTPEGYSGVEGAVEDTLSAICFLRSRFETSRMAYIGYSFGGAAALRASAAREPAGLVTLSASVALVQENGFLLSTLSRISCPCLMFHGTDDTMVPEDDSRLLSSAIGYNVRRILLDGEGHFYQKRLKRVRQEVLDFVAAII